MVGEQYHIIRHTQLSSGDHSKDCPRAGTRGLGCVGQPMLSETTAELERSASTGEQFGFDARDVLADAVEDLTVQQVVLARRIDR